VADKGFGNLRDQAAEFGLLITGDLAAAADAAGDSLDIIKLQAEGLATSFLAGLAPSIVAAMSDVSTAIKGDGVEEMKRFGAETGRILRTVIQTFRTFFSIVSGIFTGIGNQIGGLAATIDALSRGEFSQAVRIWRDAGAQGRVDFEQFKADFKSNLAQIAAVASSAAPEIKLQPKVDRSALAAEVAAAMAAVDRSSAGKGSGAAANREAEKAAREAEKIAEEQRRADEAAGRARFDLEQQILEATGRGSEAKLRALDAELAKTREILALSKGGVTAEDEAALGKVRSTGLAGINLEQALADGRAALEQLAAVRTRIEQDVQLGIRSQFQGEQDILAIERERLAILQAIAGQVAGAAVKVGTPEAQAAAAEFSEQVQQVAISVENASNSFLVLGQGAKEALNGGLVEVLTNLQSYESVGDIFQSLASSVASSLHRIAAEMLATYIQTQLLKTVLGGLGSFGGSTAGFESITAINSAPMRRGGLVGYAGGGAIDATGGGRIRGPGTGTSDSIPAYTKSGKPLLVSNGEFVVNAAATARNLDILKMINAGNAALHAPVRGMPRRLAAGGLVDSQAPPHAGEGPKGAGFAGVLGLEDGLVMKQLQSQEFDQLLVKKISRNRSALRTILSS
jgi:hypothetical protein